MATTLNTTAENGGEDQSSSFSFCAKDMQNDDFQEGTCFSLNTTNINMSTSKSLQEMLEEQDIDDMMDFRDDPQTAHYVNNPTKVYKQDSVFIGSDKYKEFLDYLLKKVKSRCGTHFICLYCWRFLDVH